MNPETRDLLTRILPFLSPAAAELVTTYLMTEEPPKNEHINHMHMKLYNGFMSEVDWEEISWTMCCGIYDINHRNLRQIVEHYENTKPNPESL
jgi:hypothetical protein